MVSVDDYYFCIILAFLGTIKNYQPVLLQLTFLSGASWVSPVPVRANFQPLCGLLLCAIIVVGCWTFRCLDRRREGSRRKFQLDLLGRLRKRVWKNEWRCIFGVIWAVPPNGRKNKASARSIRDLVWERA